MDIEESSFIRSLALAVAMSAGELLLGARATNPVAKSSPTDIVTDADRAAEAHIVERLREARPDDTIVAEEGASYDGTSGVEWVVDPLDGTVNFAYGLPNWSVSIGIEGELRAGVVYDPVRGKAITDLDRLTPSTVTDLSSALIGTGFSYSSEVRARQAGVLKDLLPRVRDIRRAGSCALDLAWVGSGRLDGFYEEDTHHWDVSAGIAIIEAAGGVVSTFGSLVIAAGNAELHARLEELVLSLL